MAFPGYGSNPSWSQLVYALVEVNPEVYRLLADKIRSSFAPEDEINLKSTSTLRYLRACLEEILHIYPPAAETLPRISPGATVHGQHLPKGARISQRERQIRRTIRLTPWFSSHTCRSSNGRPITHLVTSSIPSCSPRSVGCPGDIRSTIRDTYPITKHHCKPFTAGPRECIGKSLAYAEMQLVTARLLWNFDIQLQDRQDDWVQRQRTFVVHEKRTVDGQVATEGWTLRLAGFVAG
ncbi:hypothetical protein ETB97_005956 [Aspergillus alliaceus]|uniref:Cytochrome P450 n=1 Tax=Petromyces alliaceus TaxID=209559 RepID=A0A8H5ZXZ5_PETAA|nr:hypothetical protein ETB97_005956 [Aspergillus burnettii]